MINYRASNGGNLPMDVVSWHAYGSGGAPDTTAFYFGIADFNTYYENIKAYTDRTGRNVIGNYPIWFTEYGWSSNNVTEENQRIYTEKMINMIYQKPQIQVPFLYNYSDDGVGGEGNACGIKTVTGAMKRVYYPFVAHNSLVGLFTSDGINEWTIDEIINQYYANGARGAFGDAFKSSGAPDYGDKAHYWGPNNNGCIQEFNYGGYGLCAILSKFGTSVAFTVRGAFYNYYVTNGGPYTYGWPTSNEYQSVGTTYQNFEFGKTMIVGSTVQWIPN